MILLRQLMKDRSAATALSIIGVIVFAGVFAPWIAPHDPYGVNMPLRFASPSWDYWLGNDHLGRCVLSRIVFGVRPSVLWVLVVLAAAVLIGSVVGFIAGYFRGLTDAILMRICDVMLSFPGYVMTLAIVGILGPGLDHILLAFVALKWAWFARAIRTSVLQYIEMDYVRFAKSVGISNRRIMFRHMVPAALPDIAVLASASICSTILQISGLSFLGLGIQAPYAEWGMMLNEARGVMFSRPEMMLAPGLIIVIAVIAFNVLADAIQVALDPQLRTDRAELTLMETGGSTYGHARG